MLENYPDVLTVRQLAEILGVGINMAYKLVKDESIRSRRLGRTIRIPKVCLVEYLNSSGHTENGGGGYTVHDRR